MELSAYSPAMADDVAPDVLGLVLLMILERAGRPLTAEEVMDELCVLALRGQAIAAGLPETGMTSQGDRCKKAGPQTRGDTIETGEGSGGVAPTPRKA